MNRNVSLVFVNFKFNHNSWRFKVKKCRSAITTTSVSTVIMETFLMPELAPSRTCKSSLVSACSWLQGSMFNFSKEELDTILPPIVATMVTNVSGIWITASAIILNSFVLLVSFLLNFWKSLQFGVSLRKDILIPAPLFSPVWLLRLFSL